MRMRWWVSLLVVAVVAAGCGGSAQQTTPEVEKNELTIIGNDNAFERDQVAVNAGAESVFKVRLDREGTYVMQCTYHPEMIGP